MMAKHRKSYREKLLQEIEITCKFKLFNIKNGTASQKEKEIVSECQGFLCLLNYSVLPDREVYRLWEESSLGFM